MGDGVGWSVAGENDLFAGTVEGFEKGKKEAFGRRGADEVVDIVEDKDIWLWGERGRRSGQGEGTGYVGAEMENAEVRMVLEKGVVEGMEEMRLAECHGCMKEHRVVLGGWRRGDGLGSSHSQTVAGKNSE
jgi:hypothetical protein